MKSKIFLFSLILLTCSIITNMQTIASPNNNRRVLFISSYSFEWESVPLQIEGIQSVFDDEISLDFEFMNSKVWDDQESYRYFYESLKHRLSVVEAYDVIIVGDDLALQFAMDNQVELFEGIPIVFEGINDVDRAAYAATNPYITGVVEQISYKINIESAMKICPKADKIIGIVDNSISGIGEQKQFMSNEKSYPELQFEMLNASQYTYGELCQKISEIKDDTILLFLICGEDINGNHYSNKQAFSIISEYARVPVFRMMESGVGQGLLGGYIVSHEKSGEIAANIALQILNGADPKSIPVVTDSPNYFYYDYQIIKKYDIKTSLLPAESIFVNEDVSILKKNAGIIIPTLMYIIGGIILIGFTGLLSNLRERNKLIRKVNNKNSQLLIAVEKAEKATLQAKRANSAKTDFLSRMSHDIRTPMNAIIGLTEITKVALDNPKIVKNNLDRIDHSSKYLLELINDILAMSRIESGKETLRLEMFDIHETFTSVRDIIQAQAAFKDVIFIMRIDDTIKKYYIGDSNKLKQIIMNLLSNALKFTNPHDQISLYVREKYDSEDESAIEIVVCDTGIGVENEFLDKMFEPFEQADKDIARNHTGSGLGLSIVKHFVEMMNGNVKVESEEGVGTQFTVLVSLKKCNPGEVKEQLPEYLNANNEYGHIRTENNNNEFNSSEFGHSEFGYNEFGYNEPENVGDHSCHLFEGLHILIAEDNEINLEIAQTILEMKGFVVDTVRNGLDAVERFKEMPKDYYQCILMDIRMPVMSGIDATIAIRNCDKEYTREIPIIALTANAFQEDIEATQKAGMNAHLSKPIQPKVMFEALKKIMEL